MARSEYSRLRGIAERRLDRLREQGLLAADFHFPTVKQLQTAGQKRTALANLQEFLSGGTKLGEVRKAGGRVAPVGRGRAAVLSEEAIKQKEARERRNERRRALYAERKRIISELTRDQAAMLKGARSVGLTIKTAEINSFIEYVEYRFSQNKDSSWYTIADDYEKLQKAGKTKGDLLGDFARFKADQQNLVDEAAGVTGYDSGSFDRLWAEYIKD